MQAKIDAEKLTIKSKDTPPQDFGWTNYYHLDTINAWLEMLVHTHESLSHVSIGNSYEGLAIKGIKLERNKENPTIFIEGGIHAREWISPAVTTYILHQLLTSEGKLYFMSNSSVTYHSFRSKNH